MVTIDARSFRVGSVICKIEKLIFIDI